MAGVLKIADATDLVDRSIQNIWLKAAEPKTYYDKMYNVTKGVTDYYIKDSGLSGFGESARVVENAVIIAETPTQTFDQTYTIVEYGKVGAV
ncbi:MAG: hypothetical protein WC346_17050, partial [Methanogenium sp.]